MNTQARIEKLQKLARTDVQITSTYGIEDRFFSVATAVVHQMDVYFQGPDLDQILDRAFRRAIELTEKRIADLEATTVSELMLLKERLASATKHSDDRC